MRRASPVASKGAGLAWLNRRADLSAWYFQADRDRVDGLFENQRALMPGDRLNAAVNADFLLWASGITSRLLLDNVLLKVRNPNYR